MSYASFFLEYKWALLFYSIVILLIYLNREKFEIQAKIIALYRTNTGIKAIYRFADKYSEAIKLFGYIGIGVGFIGIIFISGTLIDGLWKILTQPLAPPVITPILPGVKIPGSPIFLPLFYGLAALFVVVVIHEFSHGIVAAAHKLRIKSTGIVLFGPLIGAFVEPDEKEVQKKSDVVQYSIFAAGPFSNMVSGILFALIIFLVFVPLIGTLSNGITIVDVVNNTPAEKAGFFIDLNIVEADDYKIKNTADFQEFAATLVPGDNVTFTSDTGRRFDMTLGKDPKNNVSAYMGITFMPKLKKGVFFTAFNSALRILIELFNWIFILSLGIGFANLLPLGPVDGGRMLQIASMKIAGSEKKGIEIWKKISLITFTTILILLFLPILKAVIGL